MPAQKRSSSHQVDEMHSGHTPHRQRRKQSKRNGGDQFVRTVAVQEERVVEEEEHQQQLLNEEQQEQQANQEDDQNPALQILDEDSDGSGTDPEEFDEVIDVLRSAVRNNVQCPICLGIIKKTRTVMGCLHRFCRECIDKSMRLGNNECPACRIHCSSRRSLRDDQDFDALIQALYPDIVTYEEQEFVLHEEEKARNEQIQASIAEICRRQSEALNKRRRIDRDADDLRVPRQHSRITSSRRRPHPRTGMEAATSNERENEHDGNLDPSPSDISQTQVRNRRPVRSSTQPPSTPPDANLDGENSESPIDSSREEVFNLLEAVHNPEMLTWGRGGARSHTRHGSSNGARNTSRTRLARFMECLENDAKIDYMSQLHVTVVSLDKDRIPKLEKPYLCLLSSFSISELREYIAEETRSPVEDIEMLLVREEEYGKPALNLSNVVYGEPFSSQADWSRIRLEVLEGAETLFGIRSTCYTQVLIIAYQHKAERRFEAFSA